MEDRGSTILTPKRPAAMEHDTDHRVRRLRTARACDACRAKKNRCDDTYPCAYCRKHGIECVTMGQVVGGRQAIPSYVRSLEDQVKQLKVQQVRASSGAQVEIPTEESRDPEQVTQPCRDEVESTSPASRDQQEVSAVNEHTHNVEFYGSSSAVAMLSHVERAGDSDDRVVDEGRPDAAKSPHTAGSIVSVLHNPAFSPPLNESRDNRGGHSLTALAASSGRRNFVPLQDYDHCRSFVLHFFASIHYIHPILCKAEFLARCDEIMRNQRPGADTRNTSFDALYYAILSLGALVGPREDEPLQGVANLQWSRIFFDEAVRRTHALGMVTDLDMVQCYFLLAKVCQNELNPHLSYMYIGLAVRTALAMGINREPKNRPAKNNAQVRAESRTWWGLYSLEVEMSFSMGRPDTLGADLYHNRQFPIVDSIDGKAKATPLSATSISAMLEPPHCAIIKIMVDLSRIIKNIGLEIYSSGEITLGTVELAFRLQGELDNWAASVPEDIRPRADPADLVSLKLAKDMQWVKRQRLVLTLRYLNLRILLFGSFLLPSSSIQGNGTSSVTETQEARLGINICIESARKTIEIIFMMYQHYDFFRTWFYNTTYVSFAASIMLVYVVRESPNLDKAKIKDLLQVVGKAIEVLETMDECVVALKSAKLLGRAMDRARKAKSSSSNNTALGMLQVSSASGAFITGPGHQSRPADLQSSEFEVHMQGHACEPRDGLRSAQLETTSGFNTMGLDMGHMLSADSGLFLNHYWGPLDLFDAENTAIADFSFQFEELGGAEQQSFNT